MKLAIVGAGWAGMAAAVEAASRGADVTVFEAARTLGGRARALAASLPDGTPVTLDNGQHILIGAYADALALMQRVGLDLSQALMALPLALPHIDGSGLQTPAWATRWPAPLDALAAIATARGWGWGERLALLRTAMRWQRSGFACAPERTLAELCAALPRRVNQELIEPLCVSALNTPAEEASAAVFLRVMRDSLFGKGFAGFNAASLLLPRTDLSQLFPDAAATWLHAQHGPSSRLRIGTRVGTLRPLGAQWVLGHELGEDTFDAVIWATAASPAAKAIAQAADDCDDATAHTLQAWAHCARDLPFTAITTVYAWGPEARLPLPMLALRPEPDAHAAPAQFVFDRAQLHPHDPSAQGLLAFVVSASSDEREDLQTRVLQQAAHQLGLTTLQPVQTVVEKRATFACTPQVVRPAQSIAPGLWAAGDYVQGPYPATLEGAVRSGLAAAAQAVPATG
ncbi:hydroxysqualene dehydroxylase HpnE [Hydrogenophaga sp.]|uniref:hydroxysqualene dehydroxylase HpnE n=1 Tax=Hydrogenophaga sp. TaxID=1904254 RepID=UPI0027269ABB|nr:hydroxysqualene dehydroxylase HpnE [Hydrogenophaga sp.]MDO9434410.1 hydroxysqualene dehydroxylase HpnE [Hydrogenophaga sp.]